MKILRGAMAGREVVPHQFGTDWITANDVDGQPLRYHGAQVLLRPDNVQLTTDQDRAVFTPDHRRDGLFWQVWDLADDGTFTRKTTVEALTRPERRPGSYVRSRRGN